MQAIWLQCMVLTHLKLQNLTAIDFFITLILGKIFPEISRMTIWNRKPWRCQFILGTGFKLILIGWQSPPIILAIWPLRLSILESQSERKNPTLFKKSIKPWFSFSSSGLETFSKGFSDFKPIGELFFDQSERWHLKTTQRNISTLILTFV